VADERAVYTFGGDKKSVALRFGKLKEGADKDRVIWKSKNLGVPSPALYNGRLYLVNMRGIGVCLETKDGKVVFDGRLEGRTGGVYSSPVIADGRMYVVSRKKGTFVYSADGEFALLARNELADKSQFNASPAVVGKELYLRSDRHLYCLAGK
jgi:outer membrane protein assembly factor BamB